MIPALHCETCGTPGDAGGLAAASRLHTDITGPYFAHTYSIAVSYFAFMPFASAAENMATSPASKRFLYILPVT